MRIAPLLLLAALILSGCAGNAPSQQAPGGAQQASAPQPDASQAPPPPMLPTASGNLTQLPPQPAAAPQNASIPPAGGGSNATAENQTTAANQTNQSAAANQTAAGNQPDATSQAPSSQNASANTSNPTAEGSAPSRSAGLPFPGSNYSLFLDDVSLVPDPQAPCGIFSIRNATAAVMERLLICPPESQYWASPEGRLYRIRADEVAAGYTKQTNWAKVEIFG